MPPEFDDVTTRLGMPAVLAAAVYPYDRETRTAICRSWAGLTESERQEYRVFVDQAAGDVARSRPSASPTWTNSGPQTKPAVQT